MKTKKQLTRRYLLAAMVGFVVGLLEVTFRYVFWCEQTNGLSPAELDRNVLIFCKCFPERQNSARVLAQSYMLLEFVSGNEPIASVLLGSTMVVPFGLYTLNALAASRRKREQRVA